MAWDFGASKLSPPPMLLAVAVSFTSPSIFASSSQGFGIKRSSSSGSSSGYNISIKENKGRLLTPEMLNSQMPQYHHLTICQDDDLLYLGYTPLAPFTPANIAFEKVSTPQLYEYISKLA